MGTRNDNGKGNIYKESKNKYVGRISLGKGEDGKYKYKKFSASTETLLKKKMKSFRQQLEIEDCSPNTESNILFKQYAQMWLNTFESIKLKPSALSRKQQTFDNQVSPLIGDIPIVKLTLINVQSMINELSQKYSYSTVKKSYEFVNACIRQYRRQHKINLDPCNGVTLPENQKRCSSNTLVFYNADQIKLIVEESRRKFNNNSNVYRLGDTIPLLIYTGMRIGELLALEWNDVDFQNKTINICKNTVAVSINNKTVLVDQDSTKTYSSTRKIPISKEAFKSLTELKKITGSNKFIMTTKRGNRIYPRNIDRMFRCICKKIGLQENGVHSLRHTFASMLFRKGCEVKTISELLGHSDVGITMNIYISLIQEQKVKAIENLDEYMV